MCLLDADVLALHKIVFGRIHFRRLLAVYRWSRSLLRQVAGNSANCARERHILRCVNKLRLERISMDKYTELTEKL